MIFIAGTSWTAKNSDFEQKLVIDLGNVRNITAIAVQGRPHSVEYVTEFTISYGYNGLDYADFKEPGGNVKVNSANGASKSLLNCFSHTLILIIHSDEKIKNIINIHCLLSTHISRKLKFFNQNSSSPKSH